MRSHLEPALISAGRAHTGTWQVAAAMLLFLAAIMGWDGFREHQQAIGQEYRLLESRAQVVDAQVSGILRSTDPLLQELARERTQLEAGAIDGFRAGLARQLLSVPEVRSLFFADSRGRIEISTDARVLGFDISGREYFRRARDDPEPRMAVSPPFVGATDVLIAIASRPLRDGQGRFLGVVGASLNPRHFEAILGSAQAGADDSSLIINTAGDILYAMPEPARFAGKSLAGGAGHSEHLAQDQPVTQHRNTARISGIEKLSVFRRIGDSGLIVVAARNAGAVLDPLRSSLFVRATVFLAALLAVLYLSRLADRRRRDQLAAEARLRSLIEQSPLPMLVAEGEAQRVVFINHMFSQVIGYDAEEVPDVAHWWPLAYPDAVYRQRIMDAWRGRFEAAQRDGFVPPVEVVVRCKSGDDRVFQVYLNRIGPLSLVVFTDFTEQRRVETALRSSEAQLNKAQEIAHLGSWHLDIPRNELLWSAETYRLFGIAPGTPLTYDLFLERVHPDDRELVGDAWQAALGGAPYDIEHRIEADGKTLWVRERAEIAFDDAGRALGGTGTVQDISDRKDAELQLRLAATVFENSREGVTITDLDRNIISVNPAFCHITGYAPEEVLGRNPRLLQSGRQDAAFYRAMWEDIDTRGYWSGEVWNRRKNGEAYPELLSIAVVRDRLGKPLHYIGVFTDISALKRSEEAIRKLNAELEQRVRERTAALESSNRELESFSYSISHDLRGPLRAIDGFSHVIAEEHGETLGESGRASLARVRAASQRMGELIDNLLDLAQVSRQDLRREGVDLSRLASGIAEELAATEPGRSVNWRIQPGVFAQGDTALLRTVLGHLLHNAWKFTAGVPAARIEFGTAAGASGPVYFVRDNGAGIDMSYADKLFKPFQRLHRPGQFAGSGIGLAIVERIVRRHGGRIRAESAPDRGTTLFFTLG